MLYRIIQRILFLLPTEFAHWLALELLNIIYKTRLLKLFYQCPVSTKVTACGLDFHNPVGIAAGLDKNGDYIDCLSALGIGFIEIGAVTPKPQLGNAKPRLFRLAKDHALVNSMGFNNKGVDYVVSKLKARKPSNCKVGINIGKNKDTTLLAAKSDYIFCFEKVYEFVDFVTINISSPNTPDLIKLHNNQYLYDLIETVVSKRTVLTSTYNKKVPILLKISPDISTDILYTLIKIANELQLDGIIATNSTTSRPNNLHTKHAGGLTGAPLKHLSLQTLKQVMSYPQQRLAVISCGGIDSANEAISRFEHGASLIQLYTGLIYYGPNLLQQCIRAHTNLVES